MDPCIPNCAEEWTECGVYDRNCLKGKAMELLCADYASKRKSGCRRCAPRRHRRRVMMMMMMMMPFFSSVGTVEAFGLFARLQGDVYVS